MIPSTVSDATHEADFMSAAAKAHQSGREMERNAWSAPVGTLETGQGATHQCFVFFRLQTARAIDERSAGFNKPTSARQFRAVALACEQNPLPQSPSDIEASSHHPGLLHGASIRIDRGRDRAISFGMRPRLQS